MNNIESIRHGDRIIEKNGSLGESLSDIGKENIEKKSIDYYNEIKKAPDGFVFFTTTSDVERAIDTREILDNCLEKLVNEDENIQVVSVNDLNKIKIAKDDNIKKYIIRGFSPSSLLGLGNPKENGKDLFLFQKFKKIYHGDSVLALKTWITKKEELETLKREIKNKVINIDINSITPDSFDSSPEDFIIPYFKFIKRVSEIADKHFPDRQWKCLQIGHDVQLDLSSIFLLEGEISLKAFEKIKNLRNFLESSSIEISNNKIIFRYNNFENIIENDFDKLIEVLKEASSIRKQEWKNNKEYDNN